MSTPFKLKSGKLAIARISPVWGFNMIPFALFALLITSEFFNWFCKISCNLISIVKNKSDPFLGKFVTFWFKRVLPDAVLLYWTNDSEPDKIALKKPSIPYLPSFL